MKKRLAVSALALVAAASAYAFADEIANERPPKAAMEAGEATFLANCAACHQPTGKGLPGAFPPLADSDYIRSVPRERLVDVVLQGFSGKVKVNGADYDGVMPSMAHLSDADIANVLSYVTHSWGNAGATFVATDIAVRRGAQTQAAAKAGTDAPQAKYQGAPTAVPAPAVLASAGGALPPLSDEERKRATQIFPRPLYLQKRA